MVEGWDEDGRKIVDDIRTGPVLYRIDYDEFWRTWTRARDFVWAETPEEAWWQLSQLNQAAANLETAVFLEHSVAQLDSHILHRKAVRSYEELLWMIERPSKRTINSVGALAWIYWLNAWLNAIAYDWDAPVAVDSRSSALVAADWLLEKAGWSEDDNLRDDVENAMADLMAGDYVEGFIIVDSEEEDLGEGPFDTRREAEIYAREEVGVQVWRVRPVPR